MSAIGNDLLRSIKAAVANNPSAVLANLADLGITGLTVNGATSVLKNWVENGDMQKAITAANVPWLPGTGPEWATKTMNNTPDGVVTLMQAGNYAAPYDPIKTSTMQTDTPTLPLAIVAVILLIITIKWL